MEGRLGLLLSDQRPHAHPASDGTEDPFDSLEMLRQGKRGTEDGILSFDEGLNNVEDLTRFFQTHNTPPGMMLHVHGYHKKTSGSGKVGSTSVKDPWTLMLKFR